MWEFEDIVNTSKISELREKARLWDELVDTVSTRYSFSAYKDHVNVTINGIIEEETKKESKIKNEILSLVDSYKDDSFGIEAGLLARDIEDIILGEEQ